MFDFINSNWTYIAMLISLLIGYVVGDNRGRLIGYQQRNEEVIREKRNKNGKDFFRNMFQEEVKNEK